MSTRSQTSDSLYSRESLASSFAEVDNWIGSHNDERTAALTADFNPTLTAEIHAVISSNPSEYAASVCDQLFTLYRDVQQRAFVLQFLPSFIVAYYDVLHRQHDESSEAIVAKDVCSTIDTFLVGLYNLGVLDDGYSEKAHEFRIPNLTIPSIYHTPNPDHYAPTPLTQHAISKHEKKCEVVRMPMFMPFDSVNATSREQILWFLLIQYGLNVSSMNSLSRQAYFKMTRKLIGQGFPFDEKPSAKAHTSPLPPTGRRIHVSSRIMSEILGTLSYFKASSIDHDASECMRLVKQRAEYEMYTDVILMTESMGYLHEFETQRPEQQDPIGIEIELPPTIEMVKQKRSATTTRSMKNRHRPHKTHHPHETAIVENDLPNETIEHITFVPAPSDADPTALTPPTSHRHRSIHDVLEEKSPTTEFIRSNSLHASLAGEQHSEESTPLMAAQTNSHIASSIGPATSSPSPSSARHYKSLTSTQTYFQSIQQPGSSSPNMQHVQTLVYHDNGSPRPRTSSMKHGDKKEMHTTVRFVGADDEEQTHAPETFL